MSTRMILNGRVFHSTFQPEPAVRYTRRVKRDGKWEDEPIDTSPLPPNHPDVPLRMGELWTDPAEGVTYRVVKYLDPLQGWATAGWWMKRHAVAYKTILKWCQLGYLQSGIEFGSPTKRYRCPNENRLFDYMLDNVHARQGRAQVYRGRRNKRT